MKRTSRIIILTVALIAVLAAIAVNRLTRENWANVEEPQLFTFGQPVLLDVETDRPAALDELRADFLLGPVMTEAANFFETEAPRGYARFDPATDTLTLHMAGRLTEIPYDPAQQITAVDTEEDGPIEVHWDHGDLGADLIAPVIIFGPPSEWAFRIPLQQARDVSDRIASQQDILADRIAAKADWRSRMEAFRDTFPTTAEFKEPTRDAFLTAWQAAITYPQSAHHRGEPSALKSTITLADQTIISVLGYTDAAATAKLAEYRDVYANQSADDYVILVDEPDLFAAVQDGYLPLVVVRTRLPQITYLTVADLRDTNSLTDVLAIAQSIAQRPLGAPNFDPLTLDRETARLALGLPTLQIGYTDVDDPMSALRSSLRSMFRPASLISTENSWSIADDWIWAYRTDGEYGSVFSSEIQCFVIKDAPDRLSDVHDDYLALDTLQPRFATTPTQIASFVASGDFAAGLPFDAEKDVDPPRWDPVWYVDQADYAFGTEGPFYYVYRAEQIGGLTMVCGVSNEDPLRAWFAIDLHRDVPRPENADIAPDILAQFRAYPDATAFGPGYFTISNNLELESYLIAGDGTVLIEDRLNRWDWDALTQTITAKNAENKVGLYLADGTKLLDHLYEDIGGWEALGPDIVRVRTGDDDLFYNIQLRDFVPDPQE